MQFENFKEKNFMYIDLNLRVPNAFVHLMKISSDYFEMLKSCMLSF
jgi:hypothetical protein